MAICQRTNKWLNSLVNTSPCIYSFISQFCLNAQETIVLGNPFTAAEGASLDLPCTGSYCQIGNGGVFRFPRAVADHTAVFGAVSKGNSL
jgi:hypothetical protein